MSDPLHQLSGQFAGLWVRQENPYGQVFAGRDATGVEVTIAVLGEGPSADPSLRNVFADAVWRHSVGSQVDKAGVYAADLHAGRPWAAIRVAEGQAGAERLLEDLGTTAPTAPLGHPSLPPPPPFESPTPTGQPSAVPSAFPGSPGQPTPTSIPIPHSFPSPAAPAPRRNGPWPWLLAAGGGGLVLVLLVIVGAVAVRLLGSDDELDPLPQATGPLGVVTAAPTDGPTPAPTESGGGAPNGEPTLRPVEAVSVVGPTFARADETYTMQFRDWPFAFRTPLPWDCFGGNVAEFPEILAWGCFGERGSNQKVEVILWECVPSCNESEQDRMRGEFFEEPEVAVQPDGMPVTRYVEDDGSGGGRYEVDLTHFFGDDPGEPPLRWMVGVSIASPPDTRADVQKILNDIVSQTS